MLKQPRTSLPGGYVWARVPFDESDFDDLPSLKIRPALILGTGKDFGLPDNFVVVIPRTSKLTVGKGTEYCIPVSDHSHYSNTREIEDYLQLAYCHALPDTPFFFPKGLHLTGWLDQGMYEEIYDFYARGVIPIDMRAAEIHGGTASPRPPRKRDPSGPRFKSFRLQLD